MPHFEVVGEAGTAAQAIALARIARPDVVIMDVSLPDGDGVDACREIRAQRPDTRVIMLSSYDNRDVVLGAILAGAAGYLLKGTALERLVESVELVARHGALLDPAVTAMVLDTVRELATRAGDQSLAGLREQERRILPLLAEGKTNAEIAGSCTSAPTPSRNTSATSWPSCTCTDERRQGPTCRVVPGPRAAERRPTDPRPRGTVARRAVGE